MREGASFEEKCDAVMNIPMVRLFAERARQTVKIAHDMACECQLYATEEYGLKSYGDRVDRDAEMLTHMLRECDRSGRAFKC